MWLYINELVIVLTGLNNLKTKVDNLYADKLKTVPVDLIKLSNIVSKEAIKNTVYNTLNTKVNNLEKNFLIPLL